MTPTPQQIQAAELAAARIKGILLDMLMADERGEAVIVVDYDQLRPVKRVTDKRAAIKLERGHWTVVEKVG